jgi:hypothetical protein
MVASLLSVPPSTPSELPKFKVKTRMNAGLLVTKHRR